MPYINYLIYFVANFWGIYPLILKVKKISFIERDDRSSVQAIYSVAPKPLYLLYRLSNSNIFQR